ncbi:hypothetical protein R8Z50_03870 [Longispora sp. K20-0274]|uniref:SCO7613 C-terminal domain-containing membrane protein n=1 Tax=Longispora sp. K20-0274 TaxID=3088255 RepID=UPI00399B0DB3
MSTYPCPSCGTSADSVTGCPGCGRPADPLAAELTDLAGRIQGLTATITELRGRLDVAMADRSSALDRHTRLLHQLRLRQLAERGGTAGALGAFPGRPADPVPGGFAAPGGAAPGPVPGGFPAPGQPAWAGPAPAGAGAAGAGAPGTVRAASAQNVLLVLGGVLLGIAAIVFVVVAWSTFGLTGRALLLGGVTALFLAAPVLLARRQLTATAETVAAVGLLLIPLDGYAARIAGFTPWSPAGYAAGVFALTACAAVAYAAATRLRAPAVAAVLAVQPVAPLLAGQWHAPAAGWSVAFALTAAADLAVAWRLFREPRGLVRWCAAGLGGLALTAAGLSALPPLLFGGTTDTLRGAGAGLAVAAVLAAAALAGRGVARDVFAGLATVPVVVVAARLIWVELPDHRLIGLVSASALLLLAAGRLPRPGRTGALVATGIAAGVAGAATLAAALYTGVAAAAGVWPAWQGAPGSYQKTVSGLGTLDWQLPAALAVTTAAVLVVSRWRDTLLVGGALLALCAPAVLGAPYWTVPVATGLAALGLGLRALREPLRLLGGVPLGLHAVAVCLGTPTATSVGLAGVVAATGLVAALGLRLPAPVPAGDAPPTGPGGTGDSAGLAGTGGLSAVGRPRGRARFVGALACGVALSTLPGLAAVTAHAAGGTDRWAGLAGMAAALLALAGAAALRKGPYLHAAATAVAVGGTAVAFATLFTAEPSSVYAAAAAVLSVAASLLPPVRNPWLLARPAVPLLWAAVSTLPALAVTLVRPYAQLKDVWHGSVVLVGGVGGRDLLLLGAVAVAATLAGYGLLGRRALTTLGLPLGSLVLLVAPVALRLPWPAAATVALGLGLGCAVLAALRPGPLVAVLLVIGGLASGAGLTGLLATRAGTLSGLGAVLVAAGVAVVAGRTVAARLVGWVVGSVTFLALPSVACAAAGLSRLWVGYALLAAAVALFGIAAAAHFAAGADPAGAGAAPGGGSGGAEVGSGGPTGAVDPVAGIGGASGTAGPETVPGPGAGPGMGGLAGAGAWTNGPVGPGAGASGPVGVARGARPGVGVDVVPEVFGWVGAVVAVLSLPTLRSAAIGCAVWGAAVGVAALRRDRGRWYALAAVVSETLAWWLLLGAARVGTPEAYTLPPALAALGLGWWSARKRPDLRSWVGYGPGLLAALLPSLAWSLPPDASVVRRVALGAAAVAVVLAGARGRLRAPLVIGAGTLLVLALHELALIWGWAPKWIPLALGGVLLIAFGATYEKRRRDLRRLRETYTSFR